MLVARLGPRRHLQQLQFCTGGDVLSLTFGRFSIVVPAVLDCVSKLGTTRSVNFRGRARIFDLRPVPEVYTRLCVCVDGM